MRLTSAIACLCLPMLAVRAQTPSRAPTAESVFARARTLVVNGNGAAGRLLVDSVVAATEPDTPAYAEALYWRATLAATSADAERDYRRIVVEYPLSPREGDALIQLAQLEVARGDRASASTHLERYLLENPTGAEATRAELMLVRVSFERNDLPRGCLALNRALSQVPESAVEQRNQLTYYQPRCVGVDTTRLVAPAPAPTPTSSAVPPKDTTRVDSTAKPKSPGKFTLQIAAYSVKADADQLSKKLKTRGFDARVVGSKKPYRVRIGRYETRAEAAAAAKVLKGKKIDARITDIGPDDR